jgi:hypothetical protein
MTNVGIKNSPLALVPTVELAVRALGGLNPQGRER